MLLKPYSFEKLLGMVNNVLTKTVNLSVESQLSSGSAIEEISVTKL
jgi:hypothetical protein